MIGDENPPAGLGAAPADVAAGEADVVERRAGREHRHATGDVHGPVGDEDHGAGGRGDEVRRDAERGRKVVGAERRPPVLRRGQQFAEIPARVQRRSARPGLEQVPVGAGRHRVPGGEPPGEEVERGRAAGLHRGRTVEDHGHGLPRVAPDPARIGEQPGERRGGEELHPEGERVAEFFQADAPARQRRRPFEEKERARPDAARLFLEAVDADDHRQGGEGEESPRIREEQSRDHCA